MFGYYFKKNIITSKQVMVNAIINIALTSTTSVESIPLSPFMLDGDNPKMFIGLNVKICQICWIMNLIPFVIVAPQ
jgi:hypothetical protein